MKKGDGAIIVLALCLLVVFVALTVIIGRPEIRYSPPAIPPAISIDFGSNSNYVGPAAVGQDNDRWNVIQPSSADQTYSNLIYTDGSTGYVKARTLNLDDSAWTLDPQYFPYVDSMMRSVIAEIRYEGDANSSFILSNVSAGVYNIIIYSKFGDLGPGDSLVNLFSNYALIVGNRNYGLVSANYTSGTSPSIYTYAEFTNVSVNSGDEIKIDIIPSAFNAPGGGGRAIINGLQLIPVSALPVALSCTDSDRGIDYYKKGNININPSGASGNDICLTANILGEYSCPIVVGEVTSLQEVLSNYTCPAGCLNGACVPMQNTRFNVDFGVYTSAKNGAAAAGNAGDYWNGLTQDYYHTGSLDDAIILNVKDISANYTQVGVSLSGMSNWKSGIYGDYIIKNFSIGLPDSSGEVKIDNLPAGNYNILVYGHGSDGYSAEIPLDAFCARNYCDPQETGPIQLPEDIPGNYNLTVGSRDYGNKRTAQYSYYGSSLENYIEGKQYVNYTNVHVNAGESVKIKVMSPPSGSEDYQHGVWNDAHKVPVINAIQVVPIQPVLVNSTYLLVNGSNHLSLNLDPLTANMTQFFSGLPVNSRLVIFEQSQTGNFVTYSKLDYGFVSYVDLIYGTISPRIREVAPILSGNGFVIDLPSHYNNYSITFAGTAITGVKPVYLSGQYSIIGIPFCVNNYTYTASKVLGELQSAGKDCKKLAVMNTANSESKNLTLNSGVLSGTNFIINNRTGYYLTCDSSTLPSVWTPSCSFVSNFTNSEVNSSYALVNGDNYLTLGVSPTTSNMTQFFSGLSVNSQIFRYINGSYVGPYIKYSSGFSSFFSTPLSAGESYIIRTSGSYQINLTGTPLTSPISIKLSNALNLFGIPYSSGSYQYTASKVLRELQSKGKSCNLVYSPNATANDAIAYYSDGSGENFTIDSKKAYWINCSLSTPYTWTPSYTALTLSCTDSDGGKDYYEKGTTIEGGDAISIDSCQNDTLFENYCDGSNHVRYLEYNCSSGCSSGACNSNNNGGSGSNSGTNNPSPGSNQGNEQQNYFPPANNNSSNNGGANNPNKDTSKKSGSSAVWLFILIWAVLVVGIILVGFFIWNKFNKTRVQDNSSIGSTRYYSGNYPSNPSNPGYPEARIN